MILFCVTQLSQILVDELLFQSSRNDVCVVTDKPVAAKELTKLGINSLLLQPLQHNVSERDKLFADLFMPGLLEGLDVGGFPIWKTLSLDRFKFWFNGSAPSHFEFLSGLEFDKSFVSLDMHSVYPWMVMSLSDECTGIQAGSLKTKEFIDFKPYLDIKEYLVNTEEDKLFLKRIGVKETISVRGKNQRKEIEYPEKDTLRNTLNIAGGSEVVGVFFDKRDEWQCRKFLADNIFKYQLLVFPVDERSNELVNPVLQEYLGALVVMADKSMLAACDRIVSFRYDEEYCLDVPQGSAVQIVDYGKMNMADIMVPHT